MWSINNSLIECESWKEIYDFFSDRNNIRPEIIKDTQFLKNTWKLIPVFETDFDDDDIDNDYFFSLKVSRGIYNFNITCDELNSTHLLSPDQKIWCPIDTEQRKNILSLFEILKITSFGNIAAEKFIKLREKINYDIFEYVEDNVPVLSQLKLEKKLPNNLHPDIDLYNYQKDGLAWLRMLDVSDRGGILGDSMGLGKTAQVISLICDDDFREKGPTLIVVRSSLIINWANEFKKFSNNLTVRVNIGSKRSINIEKLKQYDVIITSYDCGVNDMDFLEKIQWNGVILDEAHRIKNPDTQRNMAFKRLDGRLKIAMTGTPFQNCLLDIWSLSNFVCPEGTEPRELYEDDLIDYEIAEENLTKIMLRRTLDEVDIQLPECKENTIAIEMPQAERDFYNAIRKDVKEKYDKASGLVEITPLRQMCAHPLSVSNVYGLYNGPHSEKFSRLKDLIKDIISENEKCVIFSHYHDLSEIIASEVKLNKNVFCEIINGQTDFSIRQDVIDKWTNYSGSGFIVASPDACGEGLNMQAGRHIVHYTIDWNPATEAQARARVHRIGQKFKTMDWRFYYLDTIEEIQIDILNDKKLLGQEIVKNTTEMKMVDEKYHKKIKQHLSN